MTQLDHILVDVTLRAGSNETPEINLKGNTLLGFVFPDGFDGATVTIKARLKRDMSSGGYINGGIVKDPTTGNALTIYTGSGGTIPINPSDLSILQHFTLVSATAASVDRIITVVARPV